MHAEDSKRNAASGFRLLRYFTLTSFVALAVAGLALYQLERAEVEFFRNVQREQKDFFAKVQADHAREQVEAARRSLLAAHEASHVNLTGVFSNVLWRSDLASFVARVQAMPVDPCRAMAAEPRKACFGALRARIMAHPGFAALDTKIRATAQGSTVYKIKVYDLRGITAYSSEHAQIGEDKADNLGWQRAAAGMPASELTHRDQFSAFERVVEDRDVISSYIPVYAPGGAAIAGVFEIYSDVTPFVAHIKEVAAQQAALGAQNQARIEQADRENEDRVQASAYVVVASMSGLLVALYLALFLIVRRGQRLLDQQAREREESIRREQQWHREKMAALATMAANVSHEVGTPLATITLLAHEMVRSKEAPPEELPRTILSEAGRIATMTREISDFATAQSDLPELLDVNHAVKAICDFLSFDDRCRATRIEFSPGEQLPACAVVPDHLNEALMTLVQICAENEPSRPAVTPRTLRVETEARGADVVIRISGEIPPLSESGAQEDVRLEAARRRIKDMSGQFERREGVIEVMLPIGEGSAPG